MFSQIDEMSLQILMEKIQMTELQQGFNKLNTVEKGNTGEQGEWDGLGLGVGEARPYSSASSLLGKLYLPGPQMPPEFEERIPRMLKLGWTSEVLSHLRPWLQRLKTLANQNGNPP